MNIQVDDTECCLCDEKVMETNVHLFEKCKWTPAVWQVMHHWTHEDEPKNVKITHESPPFDSSAFSHAYIMSKIANLLVQGSL